jgi:hypothetical protein
LDYALRAVTVPIEPIAAFGQLQIRCVSQESRLLRLNGLFEQPAGTCAQKRR